TEAAQRPQPDLYAAYGFLIANRPRLAPARFSTLLEGLFDAAVSAEDPLYDQLLVQIVNYVRPEDKDKAGRLSTRIPDRRARKPLESPELPARGRVEEWWEPSAPVERAAEMARSNPETALAMFQAFDSQRDRQVFALITAQLLRESHPHISGQL